MNLITGSILSANVAAGTSGLDGGDGGAGAPLSDKYWGRLAAPAAAAEGNWGSALDMWCCKYHDCSIASSLCWLDYSFHSAGV